MRTWQFAGHVSQVAKPGDSSPLKCRGKPVLPRDRDGEVRTFFNVCQHRAHQLVSGSGHASLVVCPYHSWTYELTGQLRAGPNIRSVPDFPKSERLTSVRTEVFHGFILSISTTTPPATGFRGAGGARCHRPGDRPAGAAGMGGNPGKVQLEGFDRELLRVLPLLDQPQDLRHRRNQTRNLRHPATGLLPAPHNRVPEPRSDDLPHRSGKQRFCRSYSSWFLGRPFRSKSTGNRLNTYHWRPHGPDDRTVWRGWYSIDGEEVVVRQLAVQDRETTVEEDIHLVESVQRG